jgi:hypothetical protein
MIDSFVLVAPIFLLAVIALIGFIGCEYNPGRSPPPSPPQNLLATAGDARVDLTWDTVSGAIHYSVKRGDVTGTHSAIGDVAATSFPDTTVTNGKSFFYVVTAFMPGGEPGSEFETGKSNEVEALPLGSFVRSPLTPGTANAAGRAGLFGMEILVGANDIKIYTLGRAFSLGLTTAHDVKVIDALTETEIAHASVDMAATTVDDFKYSKLTSPVTLSAGRRYYVLSEEFAGGDPFFEQDTTVVTRPDATVQTGIDSSGPGVFTPAGGPGHTYGPVSFQY